MRRRDFISGLGAAGWPLLVTVINLKPAKAIGLDLPPTLLAIAGQVIE